MDLWFGGAAYYLGIVMDLTMNDTGTRFGLPFSNLNQQQLNSGNYFVPTDKCSLVQLTESSLNNSL